MKNIYFIVSLLFLVFISYVSYLNYSSLRLQTHLLKEFNENKYTDATLQKVLNSKVIIPNISVTTMPLNVMFARYYHVAGQHNKALEMLDKPINDNPYLYTKETLKATIYNYLDVRDSAEFYAKKAFFNLPGNAVNFELTMKSLVKKRDINLIKSAFDSVTKKSEVQFWQIYFGTILNLDYKKDSTIINQAIKAKKLFSNNKELSVLADFILFGPQAIKESIDINKKADSAFAKSDFKLASSLYIKASQLNPSNYTFFENAGVSLYQSEEYEQALPYLKQVVDSLNPKTGKSEYLLGMNLVRIGRRQEACYYFLKSTKFNFKPAFAELSKNCK